jgi:hypothetical protein
MEDDIRSKSFPENYASDAVRILDTMSFTKGKGVGLRGSMSIRSQQYAGDYDAFEIVNMKESSEDVALHMLAVRFKDIVKDLKGLPKTYIGDIKAGSVEEWRVLPRTAHLKDGKLVGMDVVASRRKLDELEKAKVISPNEKKYGETLLSGRMTPMKFLEAKQKLKFHIVRWSVADVMEGHKRLRDGRQFTLEEAFSSPTITKMDVISYVQNNRYTDFSMLYYFRNNGKHLNPDPYDFVDSIKENILYFTKKGNWFKVLKRKFALAKFERDASTITKLTPILNSDLGRIYHVLGDIGTLIHLLEDERPDPKSVKFEIDQFKARLANVYTLSDYLKEEHTILGEIASALKDPKQDTLLAKLRTMEDRLQRILDENTKRMTKSKGLKGGAIEAEDTWVGKDVVKTKADKHRLLASIEAQLRELAHFYENRDPATALGFRVIADDIWRGLPQYENPARAKRAIDPGHVNSQKFVAELILGKNRRKAPRDRVNDEINPLVAKITAGTIPVPASDPDPDYGWAKPPANRKQRVNFLSANPAIVGPTLYR